MRRLRHAIRAGAIALGAAAVGLLALSPPAGAAQLITWTTSSQFVQPDQILQNGPPPGAPQLAPALRVNVLLPDGFTWQKRYPVLYLLHGHGDRFDSWANPQRGDVLDIARGFPGIIVMPEGGQGWYTNWWNGGRRGDPAWESYYLDELIPLVDNRLPIRSGRRWHAIAGLSMGGEGAMYFAEQLPGYFGSTASFSGAISIQRPEWPAGFDTQGQKHLDVFGDPDQQRFYWTGHNPTALAGNLTATRLFVTVGDGNPDPTDPGQVQNIFGQIAEIELRQHAEDFVSAARAAGDRVTYQPRQGIHDWPYWRQHLAAALQWGFFGPVPSAPRQWTYQTVATSGDAWGIRYAFTPPPPSVERLRLDGRDLNGSGSGTALLRTPSGCQFKVEMSPPWTLKLPPRWRRPPHSRRDRDRASAACHRVSVSAAAR